MTCRAYLTTPSLSTTKATAGKVAPGGSVAGELVEALEEDVERAGWGLEAGVTLELEALDRCDAGTV